METLIMQSLKCWWLLQILENVNLIVRDWKGLLVWRLEDKETKPICLFWLCVSGDRSSVPLTSLKNMPGNLAFYDFLPKQLGKQLVIILASFPRSTADVQKQGGNWWVCSEPSYHCFPFSCSCSHAQEQIRRLTS